MKGQGGGFDSRRSKLEVQMIVKRGEVYFADLDPAVGSEQGGFRPVVIIQNDIRKFSDNTMEKIDFALSISVSENIHEIRSRARNRKFRY